MEQLSKIIAKPSQKEFQIYRACESTGLPKSVVTKLFESSENFLGDISDMTKPKDIVTAEQFKTSIATVFSELSAENLSKGSITSKFLDILYDMSQTKIDSVNLITIVQDVFELKDLKNLNEEQKNLSIIYDNPVMLFEGLQTILEKNNPKWGATYHLNNAYQTIMTELTKEVEEIQLSKKLHSVNTDFHLMIINDFMSGNPSPLHKNLSAVKEMLPDIQTLVFDFVLLISRYILENDSELKYIKLQTFNDYVDATNLLLEKTISSSHNSILLLPSKNYETLESCSKSQENLMQNFVWKINPEKLKHQTYRMSAKSIHDMLHFVMSCSTELGINLRPFVRTFTTKGMELISDIEQTKLLYRKFSGY